MRARVLRSASAVAALLGAAILAACGGGGGGGGGSETPTIPGTLAPLALEGTSAPGTVTGTFASFGPNVRFAVADGGWTAFVADVVGGSTQKGLFVARPDGSIVEVYLRGDAVPTPGTGSGSGTIDDFQRIWITPSGVVVAKITAIGGSTPAGIISARVPTSGAAVEKAGVVYTNGTTLPAHAPHVTTHALTGLFDDLIQVDDQGSVFFVGGTGSPNFSGIWTYSRDGVTSAAVVESGDSAPVGVIGSDFDGLGIDADGQIVAYAVDTLGGPTHAIYATNGSSATGLVVAKDGDTHSSIGGRVFENVYDTGPLYVTYGGGVSFVTWQADLNGSAPDRAVFTRQVVGGDILTLGALLAMAIPGQSVPGVGAGAFMTTIRLLDGALDPNRIPMMIDVALGTTTRVIVSCPNPTTLTAVTYDGQTVPDPAETTFTANYPSLIAIDPKCSERGGSLAFSGVLANGSSGVFWAIYGGGFFQVARQGGSVPGLPGVTFAPFLSNASVTPASGCVVFPANLIGGTAATGLFRQR